MRTFSQAEAPISLEAGDAIHFESIAPITATTLAEYADASGDHNPIHLNEEVAKKTGLPGVITHGMLVAAHLSVRAILFARSSTGREWRVKKINSRFRAMVFPDEAVFCGGQVKISQADELVLDLQAKNPRGEITTTASVVLILHRNF